MNVEQQQLARAIMTARYPRPHNPQLAEYFATYGNGRESLDFLLQELSGLLEQPIDWPGYELPEVLVENADFFRNVGQKVVADFAATVTGPVSLEVVQDFLLQHHQVFKYGTRRWLLANAGVALEQFTIAEDRVEPNFLAGLLKRGVKLGDEVVHVHVVSNNEREDLQRLGFAVPYRHWDESYYRAAVQLVGQLLASNPQSAGLFCEDSWVFDPALHRLASDGRPLVSFGFLADDRLVGERFFVGLALPDNNYPKQFEFALRSPRRRRLYEQGEFVPKTYGVFYERGALLKNLPGII